MIKKIFFTLFLFVLLVGIFSFISVNAENANGNADLEVPNPLGTHNVSEVAAKGITYVLGLVGVISLVMVIYGGLLWMTSGGKEEQIKKGKNTLVWAVFGLALIFFSYTILNFVLKILIAK